MKAAIHARVSTLDREPENQLQELRRYVAARGWSATEFVDKGVSGSKDRRPALDQLVVDAKRRRFDTLMVWRLDRLGRSLRHLIPVRVTAAMWPGVATPRFGGCPRRARKVRSADARRTRCE